MHGRLQVILASAVSVSVFAGELRAQATSETAAPAAAAAARPAEAIDPTGTWKWEYTFNDNTADFKVKLLWDGKKLTGKYTAFGTTTDIQDAKLEKDKLSFLARRELNGNEFDVNFEGQIKADDIAGTVTVDFGDEPREFDWNAKRAVEIDDVLGVWDLRLETPDGVITPRLTITKGDNNTLRGESVSIMGTREAKNMMLKDNELRWEITGDDADREFKIVYKGRPRGNRMEGTNEFDFAGQTGTMKFTAKRTPPKETKNEREAESREANEAPEANAAGAAEKASESDAAAD